MHSTSRRPRSARAVESGLGFCSLAVCVLSALSSCSKDGQPEAPPRPEAYALSIASVDTRFDTRDHFIASVEMQLAGEPFATAMGRDVTRYHRDYVCQESVCSPDGYLDPTLTNDAGAPAEMIDLAGFSSRHRIVRVLEAADEQRGVRVGRRHVAAFGPLFNPERRARRRRAAGRARLGAAHRRRQQRRGRFVHAASTPTTRSDGRGCWPTLQPFTSWDPDDPSQQRDDGLLAQLGRQSRRQLGARLQRLRVRLHHAPPARSLARR